MTRSGGQDVSSGARHALSTCSSNYPRQNGNLFQNPPQEDNSTTRQSYHGQEIRTPAPTRRCAIFASTDQIPARDTRQPKPRRCCEPQIGRFRLGYLHLTAFGLMLPAQGSQRCLFRMLATCSQAIRFREILKAAHRKGQRPRSRSVRPPPASLPAGAAGSFLPLQPGPLRRAV